MVDSSEAWISTVRLRESGPALRACITHHSTQPEDIEALVAVLGRARERTALALLDEEKLS